MYMYSNLSRPIVYDFIHARIVTLHLAVITLYSAIGYNIHLMTMFDYIFSLAKELTAFPSYSTWQTWAPSSSGDQVSVNLFDKKKTFQLPESGMNKKIILCTLSHFVN